MSPKLKRKRKAKKPFTYKSNIAPWLRVYKKRKDKA